ECNRGQERLIFRIEIDRDGEVKREDADRHVVDQQRQRRCRGESAISGCRGRSWILLLPFGERAHEHSVTAGYGRRRAEAWFRRETPRRLDHWWRVFLCVQGFERIVVDAQRDRAGGGADDATALPDDRPGNRIERHRFR